MFSTNDAKDFGVMTDDYEDELIIQIETNVTAFFERYINSVMITRNSESNSLSASYEVFTVCSGFLSPEHKRLLKIVYPGIDFIDAEKKFKIPRNSKQMENVRNRVINENSLFKNILYVIVSFIIVFLMFKYILIK